MDNLSNPSKAQSLLVDSDMKQTDTKTKLDTIYCETCREEWTIPSRGGLFDRYAGECSECAREKRETAFNAICPPLYQRTDKARLPQDQLKIAMSWQYGPRGLILLGDTGKGKTRVAWALLKRILVDDNKGMRLTWFDSIGFGHEIAKHYRTEDAESWLGRLAKAPLVFFDDLGKLKLTERAEVELFGLIERRCAAELPIIVTTNDTGDSLAARMTDNRGPALIRRLREFCEPIQF